MPDAVRLDSAHRYETRQPQGRADLQMVADAVRQQIDDVTRRIQSLGSGYLNRARDNYLGHVWINHHSWSEGRPQPDPDELYADAAGRMGGRRPVLGPRSFLKRRFFDTLQEGMDAGLVPYSTNWAVTQLIKIREMNWFYTGSRM